MIIEIIKNRLSEEEYELLLLKIDLLVDRSFRAGRKAGRNDIGSGYENNHSQCRDNLIHEASREHKSRINDLLSNYITSYFEDNDQK